MTTKRTFDESNTASGLVSPVKRANIDEVHVWFDPKPRVVFGAAISEEETVPLVEETAPTAKETAPLVEETAPTAKETSPTAKETAPLVEETAPASTSEEEETAPTAKETAPTATSEDFTPVRVVLEIDTFLNENWEKTFCHGTILGLGSSDSPLSSYAHGRVASLLRRMGDLIKTVGDSEHDLDAVDHHLVLQYLQAVAGPKPAMPKRKHLREMGSSRWGTINVITKQRPEVQLMAMHALLSCILEPLIEVFETAKAHHEEKAAEYEDAGNSIFAEAAEEMQATLDERIELYTNAASIVSRYGDVASFDDLEMEINEITSALELV